MKMAMYAILHGFSNFRPIQDWVVACFMYVGLSLALCMFQSLSSEKRAFSIIKKGDVVVCAPATTAKLRKESEEKDRALNATTFCSLPLCMLNW
jgi:hypothetical protein